MGGLGNYYWAEYNEKGNCNVIAPLHDLDQAEQWYRRSLELRPKDDQQGRGGCEAELGAVACERFQEAMAAKQPSEAQAQVEAALQHYHQALTLLPADAVNDLWVTHTALGEIYRVFGQLELALKHAQEAIRISDEGGNHYGAAQTRYNVALALLQGRHWSTALELCVSHRSLVQTRTGRDLYSKSTTLACSFWSTALELYDFGKKLITGIRVETCKLGLVHLERCTPKP